jgi:hypothetical protein
LWALSLALALCAPAPLLHAQAQPSGPPDAAPWLSTRLNADPDGAAYGFEYRGAVRGRFSDLFELYGAEARAGYGIALAPLFELHEPRHSQNVLPSQYWRARVSLEQGYTWLRATHWVRLAGLLTHESDHETAHKYSRPGFLALNDVAARLQVAGRQASWTWHVGMDARVFVVSCTVARSLCENFRGDSSFGGQLQGAFAFHGAQLWRFSPFAAASASGILPHGLVAEERRLLGRVGGFARFGDSLLSLFVLGSLGNDVGITRRRTLNVVGAGLGFAR